jgi:hypothetical protein
MQLVQPVPHLRLLGNAINSFVQRAGLLDFAIRAAGSALDQERQYQPRSLLRLWTHLVLRPAQRVPCALCALYAQSTKTTPTGTL